MFSFVKTVTVVKKKKKCVIGKTILLTLHLIAGTFIHVCQKILYYLINKSFCQIIRKNNLNFKKN